MKHKLLLVLLAVLFTACDKDENETDKSNPSPGVKTIWQGDWNNPKSSVFRSEYSERFCPMKGLWVATKKNHEPYNGLLIYEFTVNRWSISTSLDKVDVPVVGESRRIMLNNLQIKDRQDGKIFEYQVRDEGKLFVIFDGRDTFEFKVYR